MALTLAFVVLASLLAQIKRVEQETLVAHALDQTAKEIAVIAPIADAAVSALPLAHVLSHVNRLLPPGVMGIIAKRMAGDALASRALEPVVSMRLDHWLNEGFVARGMTVMPFDKRLGIVSIQEGHALKLVLRYRVVTPFFTVPASCQSLVPLWTLDSSKTDAQGDDEDEAYDPIWQKPPFARGLALREHYGATLPITFPVVAHVSGGTALAIKSLDLTAPSYRRGDVVRRRLESHIVELARFRGAHRFGVVIDASAIKRRRLLIVIPSNAPAYVRDPRWRAALRLFARRHGVTLDLRTHGRSGRYVDLKPP